MWLRTLAKPLRESGRVVRIIGNMMDITKHRQTLQIIQARLNRLTFASKNALDAVLQKTLDEVCFIVDVPVGFYHFISADERTLTLKAWSTKYIGAGFQDPPLLSCGDTCVHQLYNSGLSIPLSSPGKI